MVNLLLVLSFYLFLLSFCNGQVPGFVSIDCGGNETYADDLGILWTPDPQTFGQSANISVSNAAQKQYSRLRYFPADNRKYCYGLNVTIKTRYLIRASFLYGNFDNQNVYPTFSISIGATPWSTIIINDENTTITEEVVLLSTSPSVSICLSNGSTGQPFVSTIELRPFNNSVYQTNNETRFFLRLSARINFGAETNRSIRYPHDPFDRIWESDSSRKSHLVDITPGGTEKISTNRSINVASDEYPPEKVMQTAVVGQNGTLNYQLKLDRFPGYGLPFTYFAEIEDLGADESRKFNLLLSDLPEPIIDVKGDAQGKFQLYEPEPDCISLPTSVFSFSLNKTNDSSKGPILNALEIYQYLEILDGSLDAPIMEDIVADNSHAIWAQEDGDPCLPVPWSWVKCNSDRQPRVTSIILSGQNLTGSIPPQLANLTSLVEIWLDRNQLTGPIPDLSGCSNLAVVHLENNLLTGELPAYFWDLTKLKELYVQNNMLGGNFPRGLRGNISFNYSGNLFDRVERRTSNHNLLYACIILGSILLLVACISPFLLLRKRIKGGHKQENYGDVVSGSQIPAHCSSSSGLITAETATNYPLSELAAATDNFSKRVGSGGYGLVYYGKLGDGIEIAVKVLKQETDQGTQQFLNEVALLSRVHHRNLVSLLGYCYQDGNSILVYEFMHNGNLKDHIHRPCKRRSMNWMKRLEIAEDAAKGIEYLHNGCSPSIIHRDLKTSNILLDEHMRAKVADFGLSKSILEDSHVTTMVKGTMGYLDPEYYVSQQLTAKSDVYSFGIILLELICGQEPISTTSFGREFRNIGSWAKFWYESGDTLTIVDPSLEGADAQSVRKVVEVALNCIQHDVKSRPSMEEVVKEIQEAMAMERAACTAVSDSNSARESSLHCFTQTELR